MDDHTVSVITPSLNRAEFLEGCIKNVLAQDYPFVEHIIADGGSTDGTLDILEKFSGLYPDKVKYFSKIDKGAGEALNRGLAIASGDIVSFLCSDDVLASPDVISSIVNFFNSTPEAHFLFGKCKHVNEKKEVLHIIGDQEFNLDELINDVNWIPCPSAFFRKIVTETIGGWDTYGNDLDYMIRLAKVYPVYQIDKILSIFLVHNNSETGSFHSYVNILRKDWIVSRKHGGRFFSKRGRRYLQFLFIQKFGLQLFYTQIKRRKNSR